MIAPEVAEEAKRALEWLEDVWYWADCEPVDTWRPHPKCAEGIVYTTAGGAPNYDHDEGNVVRGMFEILYDSHRTDQSCWLCSHHPNFPSMLSPDPVMLERSHP